VSAPTVSVGGDRNVAVTGDVHGIIVTGDDVSIVVRQGPAGTVLDPRRWRRARIRPRRGPAERWPPSFPDHLGRVGEAAALRGGVRAQSVVGEAHVGKTYVVSATFARGASGPHPPHGVVYVYARGLSRPDLLQQVFEELFTCRPPRVPTESELLRALADREALVVADGCDLDHGDAQAVTAALPRSRVVLVSREPRWWDGELTIGGLAEPDALALLARELGAADPGDDVAARAICRLLGGHPLRLRQLAASLRTRPRPLAEVAARLEAAPSAAAELTAGVLETTTARERDVMAVLASYQGETIEGERLEDVAGPGAAAVADGLVERGLAARGSPRYGSTVPAELVPRELRRRADRRTVEDAVTSGRAPGPDLAALLVLLRRLVAEHRTGDVLRLGHRLVPELVRARRFTDWRTVAGWVLHAARSADDLAAQAWALHEAGSHAATAGDTQVAQDLLTQAVRLREQLGDEVGADASRHNLRTVTGAGGFWRGGRGLLLPFVVALLVATAVVARGGADDRLPGTGEEAGSGDLPSDAGQGDEDSAPDGEQETDGVDDEVDDDEVDEVDGDDDGASTGPDEVELEVAPEGEGAGVVTGADGAIACPDRCTATVLAGEEVTLEAEPGDGSVLVDWAVDGCEGTTCTLVLDEDTKVAPRFEPLVDLGVVIEGGTGVVTVAPDGDRCGPEGPCTFRHPVGTAVTLEAEGTDDSIFDRWVGGGCTDDAVCTVVLDQPVDVVATFLPPVVLTVDVSGPGGTVTSEPAGVLCDEGTCTAWFPFGTEVELTPTSAEGHSFSYWADDCDPQMPVCELALTEPRTATAVFEEND
jgi:hypothetical protein